MLGTGRVHAAPVGEYSLCMKCCLAASLFIIWEATVCGAGRCCGARRQQSNTPTQHLSVNTATGTHAAQRQPHTHTPIHPALPAPQNTPTDATYTAPSLTPRHSASSSPPPPPCPDSVAMSQAPHTSLPHLSCVWELLLCLSAPHHSHARLCQDPPHTHSTWCSVFGVPLECVKDVLSPVIP